VTYLAWALKREASGEKRKWTSKNARFGGPDVPLGHVERGVAGTLLDLSASSRTAMVDGAAHVVGGGGAWSSRCEMKRRA
jgi:hypothetical protein